MVKFRIKKTIRLVFFLVLIGGLGCIPAKMIWTSEPDAGMSSNKYFQAKLVPLKQGQNYFVTFRVEVINLTQNNLAIDWNKTFYFYNGHKKGLFVYKGINPEDIKNRNIPIDIIPPKATYTKIVAPFKLLSRAPLRDADESNGIKGGILPNGESGMRLVIEHEGEELVEVMKVLITEKVQP